MPTLAAILIFAAVGSLRPGEIATILRTGPNSQIALITTFVATLFLPVAAAVGIGVVISLLLQLNQEADRPRRRRAASRRRRPVRREARRRRSCRADAVTVLDVYGSLFYAGVAHAAGPPARPDRIAAAGGRAAPARAARRSGRRSSRSSSGLRRRGSRPSAGGCTSPGSIRPRRAAAPPATTRSPGTAALYEATPVVGVSTTERDAGCDDVADPQPDRIGEPPMTSGAQARRAPSHSSRWARQRRAMSVLTIIRSKPCGAPGYTWSSTGTQARTRRLASSTSSSTKPSGGRRRRPVADRRGPRHAPAPRNSGRRVRGDPPGTRQPKSFDTAATSARPHARRGDHAVVEHRVHEHLELDRQLPRSHAAAPDRPPGCRPRSNRRCRSGRARCRARRRWRGPTPTAA